MRVHSQLSIAVGVKGAIFKNRSGQVLVETMVALSVATIGILGTMSVLAQSMATAKFVGDQYVASYLAAEGIEDAKFTIDSNVLNCSGFSAPVPTDESLGWDGSGYVSGGTGSTIFTRTVRSNSVGSRIEVTSVVSWPVRGGGNSSVTLVDYFYNWRNFNCP
ncbi:MAG: hypothetical protein WC246_02430 [Candidatus Paceibacterota bacterium]|jgi:hypothetical protein